MAQFSVHKNRNPQSRNTYPYLVDIQTNLLDGLQTRVVVPLAKLSPSRKVLQGVTPVVEIGVDKYLLMAPQLAGIAARDLGPAIDSLANQRDVITAALDFLFFGI